MTYLGGRIMPSTPSPRHRRKLTLKDIVRNIARRRRKIRDRVRDHVPWFDGSVPHPDHGKLDRSSVRRTAVVQFGTTKCGRRRPIGAY